MTQIKDLWCRLFHRSSWYIKPFTKDGCALTFPGCVHLGPRHLVYQLRCLKCNCQVQILAHPLGYPLRDHQVVYQG